MSVVDDTVAQLLCVHLGLVDFNSLPDDSVRDYRDLYRLPLRSFHDKCQLLSAAEATGCSAVILDVLLFVSETMAPPLFSKQLVAFPLSLNQWVYYLVEQCMVTNETVSLGALRGLLDLYAGTNRYRDLAAMLLSLVFYDKELNRSLKVTDEVLEISKLYRHRFPAGILELLDEYVTLTKLQIETEIEDVNTAPEVCTRQAFMDKRSRGVSNLQANWRMRSVQLTEKEIVYYKHEGKLDWSGKKALVLDKTEKKSKKKGSLVLTRGMQVDTLDYRGKFSLRPSCVRICDAAGSEQLILDAFTPAGQRQWVAAITCNVKRLGLDPRWMAFPRRCVHRMTVGEFLRYSMLYHGDVSKSHTRHSSCQPGLLRERFKIDPKRYLFSALLTCALVRDWKTMEALVQPRSAKSAIVSLFLGGNSGKGSRASGSSGSSTSTPAPSPYSVWSGSTDTAPSSSNRPSVSSNDAPSRPVPTGMTEVQAMVDASAIGYGAILDIAEQRNAPPNLLALLESLHEKNGAKRERSTGWACRRDVDASDAASMKITIDIPESVRVDTSWD